MAVIGLGFLAILIFLWRYPWGMASGYANWGNQLYYYVFGPEKFIGLKERPFPPWLHPVSVNNLGLLMGALASALMGRQFKLNLAPAIEYPKGLLGGIFMGAGAALAGGCNIGGFYTAIGVFSVGGYAMMVGLGAGAYIGLRYLLWETKKLPLKTATQESSTSTKTARTNRAKVQPYIGGSIIVITLAAFYLYSFFEKTDIGGCLFFGLLIGLIMHRSRFCFVRPFSRPFMTGEAEMVKVVAMGLIIYGLGSAVIKWTFLQPDTMGVDQPFWVGSLLGGLIFGIGMVIAGAEVSGTLWRIGEGNTKLMATLIGFSLTNSLALNVLKKTGLIDKLGKVVFLPKVFTWYFGLPLFLIIPILWVLVAIWNEKTKRFVIFTPSDFLWGKK